MELTAPYCGNVRLKGGEYESKRREAVGFGPAPFPDSPAGYAGGLDYEDYEDADEDRKTNGR